MLFSSAVAVARGVMPFATSTALRKTRLAAFSRESPANGGRSPNKPFNLSIRAQRCSLQVRDGQGLAIPSSDLSYGYGETVLVSAPVPEHSAGRLHSNMAPFSVAERTDWGLPSGDRTLFSGRARVTCFETQVL